jgi:hypothetical protein
VLSSTNMHSKPVRVTAPENLNLDVNAMPQLQSLEQDFSKPQQ